jgi:hypothetical protein
MAPRLGLARAGVCAHLPGLAALRPGLFSVAPSGAAAGPHFVRPTGSKAICKRRLLSRSDIGASERTGGRL